MLQIIPENAIAFSGIILWGRGKKVMAPVQSRMGAIFGVTIYYFSLFPCEELFHHFLNG